MSNRDATAGDTEKPQASEPDHFLKGLSYSKHVMSFQTEPDCPRLPLDQHLLDAADFELGALRIWIHRRQFPDEPAGSEDADWLCITAGYETYGASAWAAGPILRLSALAKLSDHLKTMREHLRGKVVFEDRYPYVRFELEIDKTGKIEMKTKIRPDYNSDHTFHAQFDQTYLTSAIRMLDKVSARYKS